MDIKFYEHCRICNHILNEHIALDNNLTKVCAKFIEIEPNPIFCSCEDFIGAADNLKYVEYMYDRKVTNVSSMVQ